MAENETLDLVWGAAEIAKVIGLSRPQTYNLLNKGELPAKKMGPRKWVARRSELEKHFSGTAA
ncbi:helix-turn-helix transcriptional regulator [Martelella mediterranea]|uniref:DNA binding domain, excisionase family n=1 Tax=Martelella mediterranea DSM 17316 TaxID=1122214 RepID=A0A1U9YYM9_9HYPH|nr:helix-turn-helix domain-containing protein [Martelella mediterranea]AQZ50547.1 DNA binding domain, excisionase family [Martelella mediterranea DSM 17316]